MCRQEIEVTSVENTGSVLKLKSDFSDSIKKRQNPTFPSL